MSDKDFPFIFVRSFTIVFAVISFHFLCVNSVNPWLTYEVEVASKTEFPSDCVDGNGDPRTHLENWTTGCNSRVCYAGFLETLKWQVNYDCPGEINYPDTVNCYYTSDSALPFPHCCPYLECPDNTANITTPAPCADRSPAYACSFWMEQTNCTSSTDSLIEYMYNLTLNNCIDTCGYCAP